MKKKAGIYALLIFCIGVGILLLFPAPIVGGMLRLVLSSLGYPAELELSSVSFHEAQFGPSSLCMRDSQICFQTKNLSFVIERAPFAIVLKAEEVSFDDYAGKDVELRLSPMTNSARFYSFARSTLQIQTSTKSFQSSSWRIDTLLLHGTLSLPEKSLVVDELQGELFLNQAGPYPFSGTGKGAVRDSIWHFEGTPIFAGCVGIAPLKIDFHTHTSLTSVSGECVLNRDSPRSEFLPKIQVEAGELRVGMQITIDLEKGGKGLYSLKAKNLAASMNTMRLQGMNGTVTMHQQGDLWDIPASSLSAQNLDAGLVFTNIKASFKAAPAQFSKLVLQVPDATAEVFGGKLFLKKARYQGGSAQNTINIGVDGIDLEEIIALYKQPDIFVSGRVDGNLPISLTPQGFLLEDGKLQARDSGGSIQVTGETAASIPGIAQLEFVRKALEDYRYTRMELNVNYQPNGILKTGISLSGKSKSLNTDRPINVNINLEENILSLIRSLGIVSEVQDKILKATGE